ncbi:MAG: hypothetical protein E6Q96_08770, partial [Cyclobacteriaceae bacterium]
MRFLLIVVAVVIGQLGFAQTFVRNNIIKASLRNTGSITEQGKVKGYYSFYDIEKKDSRNNNYQLVIFDENLREINSIDITKPRTYGILDGAFNGKAFCFFFYDHKKRATEMISYDSALRQIGLFVEPVTNKDAKGLKLIVTKGISGEFLEAVPDRGFVKYGTIDEKALYKIQFFDNQMRLQWTTEAPGRFKYEFASNSFVDKNYVGSTITSTNKFKHVETSLIVHRIDDGTKLFHIPLATNLHNVVFSKVYFDQAQQKFIVIGEYYNKQAKEGKEPSLGFIMLTLGMDGTILDQKLTSWTDISKVAPVTTDGKFDGSNIRMVFHDIVRTRDGELFVVGEQYEKAISGAGVAAQGASVALALLTGVYVSSTSTVQLNVYNMVILHFNPDLSINKIHLFEKSKSVMQLPPGSGFMSSKQLSVYAQVMGGFDYAYTQTTNDGNSFVVTYIDYEKGSVKGVKPSNVLGS